MTVVRQGEWEDLDGFQIDWGQFLIPYNLGCDIVDAFSCSLKDACEAEDKLTTCAIVWFMLVANGLYVPPRVYACRCDSREVGSLVLSLRLETCHGGERELHRLLIDAAAAAGIYEAESSSADDG